MCRLKVNLAIINTFVEIIHSIYDRNEHCSHFAEQK